MYAIAGIYAAHDTLRRVLAQQCHCHSLTISPLGRDAGLRQAVQQPHQVTWAVAACVAHHLALHRRQQPGVPVLQPPQSRHQRTHLVVVPEEVGVEVEA